MSEENATALAAELALNAKRMRSYRGLVSHSHGGIHGDVYADAMDAAATVLRDLAERVDRYERTCVSLDRYERTCVSLDFAQDLTERATRAEGEREEAERQYREVQRALNIDETCDAAWEIAARWVRAGAKESGGLPEHTREMYRERARADKAEAELSELAGAVRTLLRVDGGEGSECWDAQEHFKARPAVFAALARVAGEGERR